MFHLRRRRQESYWYLSDDDGSLGGSVGQIEWRHQEGKTPLVIESDDDDEAVVSPAARKEDETPVSSSLKSKLTLNSAMALQTEYTSWTGSIWEINFDDAEEEILFDSDVNDDYLSSSESSSKKSMGTMDTEDETLPSPCSTPEFLNNWEFDGQGLSALVEEEPGPEGPLHSLDVIQGGRALLGCSSTDARLWETGAFPKSLADTILFGSVVRGHRELPPLPPRKPKKRKRLRFADEEGKTMETVHVVPDDEEDPTRRRLLILMMVPKEKKYEFIHAEYSTDSQLSVSALLRQLPGLAEDPLIQKQRYSRLCRAAGGIELINALSIQSYDLPSDEILVAVLKGYTGKAMHEMARTLVQNEKILRAVKRTNRAAHTLHSLERNPSEDSENALQRRIIENHTGKVLEINVSLDIRQDRGRTMLRRSSYSTDLREEQPKHAALHEEYSYQSMRIQDEPNPPEPRESQDEPNLPEPTESQAKQTLEPIEHISGEPTKQKDVSKGQRKHGFFGTKMLQRHPSYPKDEETFFGHFFHHMSTTTKASNKSDGADGFGRKLFYKRSSHSQPSDQAEEGAFKKAIQQIHPSRTRASESSNESKEAATGFGRKLFHRRPSAFRTAAQPSEEQHKEATSSHGTKSRSHWPSRLTTKRWGKLKHGGKRRNEVVNVKQ